MAGQCSEDLVNVYMLADPRSMTVRYVGSTVAALSARVRQHCHGAASRSWGTNQAKREWLRELERLGMMPLAAVVEFDVPRHREWWWIERYREEGASLLNGGLVQDRSAQAEGRYAKLVELHRRGLTVKEVAHAVGYSTNTVRALLSKLAKEER